MSTLTLLPLSISWTTWDWTVVNFGNYKHLAIIPWSFGISQVIFGISASIVRGFYVYRVWIISNRKNFYVPILIILLSLASLACALGGAAIIIKKKYFTALNESKIGVSVWLALATAADATITASLVYYLARSKNGGIHSTNNLINKLIELIVSTNGLSVLTGLVTAILFWTLKAPWHIATNAMLNYVYTLSLLVSLNARLELERRINNPSSRFESHGLTELTSTGGSTMVKGSGADVQKRFGKKDLRTALGFGREDVRLEYNENRRNGVTRSLGEGIQVVTHQTVVTDGENGPASTTYLSTPTSEKGYYSNEKEEEASTEREERPRGQTNHFANDLQHR
ncbi:DUF6534 domain-containing protein [Sporobolomyces salmoneus]|uniref:DUF6534 domain-containing protein n=1 Tax=Sporobolomyces salmoneus TaxID=183962 RepID=UPI0031810377